MRYSRVLAVMTLMVAVGLGAVALARSPQTSPATQLHLVVQQMAKQFVAGARQAAVPPTIHRATAPSISIPVPQLGGTTCFVATGCSIRPCVVPVAAAVAAPMPQGAVVAPILRKAISVPALRNAASGCPLGDRVPKPLRVSAPTLSATPR